MEIDGQPLNMKAVQVTGELRESQKERLHRLTYDSTALNKPHELTQVELNWSLGPYELLIKTVAASLCHTDLMMMDGTLPAKLPFTASHEGSGHVVAIGSAVHDFNKGDRVMSGLILNPCTSCEDCQGPDDQKHYCKYSKGIVGLGLDGAFADFHVTDSRMSCKIPDSVSFTEAAALACAGRTVYRAIKTSEVKSGQFLAIIGAGGGLGHLGIQFARAKGINVIAIDVRDEALNLCKHHGAKYVLDARQGQDKVAEEVRTITGRSGADATINLSAHPTALTLACAVTRMHGTMVQVAGPNLTSVSIFDLVFRDIKIKGSMLASLEVSKEMLAEYASHDIKVDTNIFLGLDQVSVMVDTLKSGKMKGKAVCVVDQEALARDDARRMV